MDTNTIWVGIIVPLLVGPICIFFKSLYDNYKKDKNETLRLKYNEKIDSIKSQLNEFYYPLYIKLIRLYNYDYNIPISKEQLKIISNQDNHDGSSDEQTCDSSDNDETNICKGYYLQENNSYHKCNNIIPINSIEDICKECRWKSCHGEIELKIEEERDLNKNENQIENIVIDFSATNLDDDLDENKMEKKLKEMSFLKKVPCEKETIEEMQKNINTLYSEIKDILSKNMISANPNVYMKEHFIQLLKYIDLYLMSKSTGCEFSIYESFGIKNNTVKVLKIVEKRLYKLNKKHRELIKNGPFFTN